MSAQHECGVSATSTRNIDGVLRDAHRVFVGLALHMIFLLSKICLLLFKFYHTLKYISRVASQRLVKFEFKYQRLCTRPKRKQRFLLTTKMSLFGSSE